MVSDGESMVMDDGLSNEKRLNREREGKQRRLNFDKFNCRATLE